MAGEIGLTNAGQYLDDILTKNNPPYKNRLVKFITNFTATLKRTRPAILQCDNMNDKHLILKLLKDNYTTQFDETFKEIVDKRVYTLTRNYIHALTRVDFIPTTKTQINLINRQLQLQPSI